MKQSIRDAYGNALCELGEEMKQIVVLDADVSSSTKSGVFGKQYPERFINVGVAENNMISMAAGLSIVGYIPFVNTFATFMVGRGADPLKSLIAYGKLNVKVAGAYAGLSDSYDGATHHALEDLAFFRSLPNFTVISVADGVQARKAVKVAAQLEGPVYLRLSRAEVPILYDESTPFELGKGDVLEEGKDLTIIATGVMVSKALEASQILKNEGITTKVINIHTIKPIDQALIVESAKQTGRVLVVEEHNINGGLGSAVCEVLSETYPVPVKRMGTQDCFTESGDYEALLCKYGLDATSIVHEAITLIRTN
ncbi:transketolase family protein [Niameybacter massiliensis]|uniref:Transketolase family protein n=1 Tax=Holtiella tumoricola TaxID=3018743 RepID=A0AA42DMB1_9FIRM|nr:transketolase family protein [Holtiella tumoricola]MDA3731782.1 transketolase family protein [Holtiella tumoricola]